MKQGVRILTPWIKEGHLRTMQSPKINLDAYFVVSRVVDCQCINGQGKIRLIEIK